MGGPWRARGFDSAAWRRPDSRVAVRAATDDHTARLVLAYVVAVLAVGGGLLILLARFA
jgi:hypothetical protein